MELGELNIHIGDGNYSSKYPKNSEFLDEGVPFISASDFEGRVFSEAGMKHISEEQHSTLLKGHLKPRDILVVVRGNGCGKVGYVPEEYDDANINAQLALLRCDNETVSSEYLYYQLSTNEYQNKLKALCSGSAQPQLPLKSLKKLQLELPSYDIQLKIAQIAKTIDDKILNNSAINRNLLEQANVLFESWFIYYEPFGGRCPQDWEDGILDDIIDFYNGYAFKSKELLDSPDEVKDCYQVFKQGHINRGGGFNPSGTKSWYLKEKATNLQKYVLRKGDILMAMTDMKDNVAILGNTAVMEVDDTYILNQRVALLRANGKKGIGYPFVSLLTNSHEFLTDLRSRANSGVQVNLSANEIRNSKVKIPSQEVNKEFDSIVTPLFERMIKNDLENQRLQMLRDTLLPKLMSGELDVSNLDI